MEKLLSGKEIVKKIADFEADLDELIEMMEDVICLERRLKTNENKRI
jgi:hypothetical protein